LTPIRDRSNDLSRFLPPSKKNYKRICQKVIEHRRGGLEPNPQAASKTCKKQAGPAFASRRLFLIFANDDRIMGPLYQKSVNRAMPNRIHETARAARSPPASRDAAYAVGAGFLGWTLDAFDFALVPISTRQIAKEFDVPDATIAISVTLTLMFRPVGALIFGLVADRYGRRIPLMVNLLFFSAVEVATGLAPNLTTFMILRALFGIGMGGEWGVGASLVMEKVSPRWRGVLSGLLQEGYAIGFLLAALAAHFMLDAFGWRSLFFLGGLPALLAVFVRFFVKESEVWQKTKAESWSHLGRAIRNHWRVWLYLTLLMAMLNFASHGTQDAYKIFLEAHHKIPQATAASVFAFAMVGAVFGGIIFGLASDQFGRRRMMIAAFAGALCVVPLWALSSEMRWIVAGGFAMQFMVQGAWGVIPAHICELSPNQVRGFLPGFSYQCGNLVAASIMYVQTSLGPVYGFPVVLAISASAIFIVAIVVVAAGRERRGLAFHDDAPL
jgi:SHS family lactate transporter-like MFS transporter